MSLRNLLAARRGEIDKQIEVLRAELAEITVAEAAIGHEPTIEARLKLRQGSIKEAVIGVLRASPRGLKTDEIIEGLKNSGMIVMRSSLTPQLSRLKAQGALQLMNSHWILTSLAEPSSETSLMPVL